MTKVPVIALTLSKGDKRGKSDDSGPIPDKRGKSDDSGPIPSLRRQESVFWARSGPLLVSWARSGPLPGRSGPLPDPLLDPLLVILARFWTRFWSFWPATLPGVPCSVPCLVYPAPVHHPAVLLCRTPRCWYYTLLYTTVTRHRSGREPAPAPGLLDRIIYLSGKRAGRPGRPGKPA